AATIVTGVALVLSVAIIRRTPRGEGLYRRWKTYRKALARAGIPRAEAGQLGQHFIYGVAFGIRRRRIESLFEGNFDVAPALYWMVLHDASASSPAAVARAFSRLNASGTAAFGSAVGVSGGGASAGSAGGGA